MKKLLLFILAPAMFLMTACDGLNLSGPTGDLTDVTDQISSIDKQIESIQGTLDLLKKTDEELRAAIDELKKSGVSPEAVEVIETKLEDLEKKIAEIEKSLKDTKDWASTTFATLEQYKELSGALADLTEAIRNLPAGGSGNGSSGENNGGVDMAEFTKMIEECTASMQDWVSEKLTGYQTLAEAEAVLETLKASISEGDKALLAEIEAVEKELAAMEARLTEAYKKAIEEALKNNGAIPPSADLDGANGELDSSLAEVIAQMTDLAGRVNKIEGTLEEIMNMVQSVNFTLGDYYLELYKAYPYYDSEEIVRLNFLVSPKKVVSTLAENYKDVLSFQVIDHRLERTDTGDGESYVPVKTYSIPFSACKANPLTGILSADLAIKDIPEEIFIDFEMYDMLHSSVICISYGNTEILSPVLRTEFWYDSYPNHRFPSYEYSSADCYYIGKAGSTWKLNLEEYGISADDEIITVGNSLDDYINGEDWMTVSWDENTGEIAVSTTDNMTGTNRKAYITILTDKASYRIGYCQYCDEGTLDVDTTELTFSYNDEEEKYITMPYYDDDIYVVVQNDNSWIETWEYNDNLAKTRRIYFRVERQREPSDTLSREGIVTISDGRGKTAEIKVIQELITEENLRISTDKDEVSFTWEGGAQEIQVTHPAGVDVDMEFHHGWCDKTIVDDETTIFVIQVGQNKRSEAIDDYLSIRARHEFIGELRKEIPFHQGVVTAEEMTVVSNPAELHFPSEGGTLSVTLTHMKGARMWVERNYGALDCSYTTESVDEETTTLYITVEENHEDVAREGTVYVQIDDWWELDESQRPTTNIRITQDAPVPAKVTVEEFLAAEESSTVWYELTGTISNLTNTTYGNFDLVDDTGSVYVYGLTSDKVDKNDKSFSELGLEEGDTVTIIGKRSSYNGVSQVGGPAYYVSHIAGENSGEGE